MQSRLKAYVRLIPLSQVCGAGMLFLFLTILSLAVLPELHEELHEDAHEEEHSCAVTLILSGGTDVPTIATQVESVSHFIPGLEVTCSVSLPPLFLCGYVREHAPPPLS
jgi:hypothetical protein